MTAGPRRPRLDEVFETLITRLIYEAEDELAQEQADLAGGASGGSSDESNAGSEAGSDAEGAAPTGGEDEEEAEVPPELAPLCQRNLGLVSPLWWWTHRVAPSGSLVGSSSALSAKHAVALHEREAKMVYHLLLWLQGQKGGKVGGSHRQQHQNLKDGSAPPSSSSSLNMRTVKILTVPDVLTHIEVLVKEQQMDRGVTGVALKGASEFFGGAELISTYHYATRLYQTNWDIDRVNTLRGGGDLKRSSGEDDEEHQEREEAQRKQHLKEDPTAGECSVAIWALGSLSVNDDTVVNFSRNVEEYAAAFLGQAQEGAIAISDGGWIHQGVNWQSMRTVRGQKLGNLSVEGLDGLFGSALPVACPVHPAQSKTAVTGVESIFGFCNQVCLASFGCGQPNHVCTRSCHVADADRAHTKCPYLCTKPQPCGHPCKVSCGEPCNCLKIKEVARTCSHKELLSYVPPGGTGQGGEEPQYQEVTHHIKGVCCYDLVAKFPECTVKVNTPCSTCDRMMELTCHEASKNSEGKDGDGKEGGQPRCATCVSKYRSLRAEIRVKLSQELEAKKQEMLRGHRKNFESQSKAAAKGVFKPGQLVRITADEAIRDNQEDQFPNVKMEDWFDAVGEISLVGAQCTVVAHLVDFTALEEVHYLVMLPESLAGTPVKYCMMADTGLALLQALTAGGSGGAAGGPLLLTAGSHQLQQQQDAEQHHKKDDSAAAAATANNAVPPASQLNQVVPPGTKNFLYPDLPALGQVLHLHTPTVVVHKSHHSSSADDSTMSNPTTGREEKEEEDVEELIANIAVKVVGHADSENLEVEYYLPKLAAVYQQDLKAGKVENGDGIETGRSPKRRRLESVTATTGSTSASGSQAILPYTIHTAVVPAAAVSPLFTENHRVVVTDSTKQCVALSDKRAIPKGMYHASLLGSDGGAGSVMKQNKGKKWKPLTSAEVYPHRLSFESSCIVVGVTNGLAGAAAAPPPPIGTTVTYAEPELDDTATTLTHPGPYYILRPATVRDNQKDNAKEVKANAAAARSVGKKSDREQADKTEGDDDCHPASYQVILVPVGAVSTDHQFEAEKVMNKDTLQALEETTATQFGEWAAAERLRQLEKSWAFYQEKAERLKKQEMLKQRALQSVAPRSSSAAEAESGTEVVKAFSKKSIPAVPGKLLSIPQLRRMEEEYVTKSHRDQKQLETAKQLQRQAERRAKENAAENNGVTTGATGWEEVAKQHQQNRNLDNEYFDKKKTHPHATGTGNNNRSGAGSSGPQPSYGSYPQPTAGRRY